jgi:hypothetical protein
VNRAQSWTTNAQEGAHWATLLAVPQGAPAGNTMKGGFGERLALAVCRRRCIGVLAVQENSMKSSTFSARPMGDGVML